MTGAYLQVSSKGLGHRARDTARILQQPRADAARRGLRRRHIAGFVCEIDIKKRAEARRWLRRAGSAVSHRGLRRAGSAAPAPPWLAVPPCAGSGTLLDSSAAAAPMPRAVAFGVGPSQASCEKLIKRTMPQPGAGAAAPAPPWQLAWLATSAASTLPWLRRRQSQLQLFA
jgi:hypothetical protein